MKRAMRPRQTPYKVCGDEAEATRFLHDQAARLERRGLTGRYGVKMRPCTKGSRRGHWVVLLVDRAPSEAPPVT